MVMSLVLVAVVVVGMVVQGSARGQLVLAASDPSWCLNIALLVVVVLVAVLVVFVLVPLLVRPLR